MKKLLLSLAIALHSAAMLLAGDIIYLKADAVGAGDGSSWTDAYTSPADAIADGNASGKPIYIAKGLYTFSTQLCVTRALAIYGGFAGESLEETPEGRDIIGNATIFSGDINKSHYWVHYTPNKYAFDVENLTDAPLIVNDTLSMPPAFTGDYDGYRINAVNNSDATLCPSALELSGGVCTLDGITFIGFRTNRDKKISGTVNAYGVLNVANSAKNSTISNCRFIGNYSDYGAIYSNNALTVNNCQFLYNVAAYRCSGLTVHGGRMTVNDCYFLNSTSLSNLGAGNVFNGWGGGFTVNRTTVERCALVIGNSYTDAYGGPGNLYAAENGSESVFNDCVIKNLYTGGSNARCLCTVSTGQGALLFNHCLFTKNKQVVKPGANACYALFGSTNTDKRMYFDSCTFSENSIEAPEVALTSGSYVLSIIGNPVNKLNTALVNCTFADNTASAEPKAGIGVTLCRGVTCFNSAAGINNQTGLANCTFYGEANGLYDFAQVGQSHSQKINIVNCLFMAPGEAVADPIYADKPALVNIYSSAIQNKLFAYPEMAVCDFTSDAVPLLRENVNSTASFILRPDANPPCLRSTANVATNDGITVASTKRAWAFKPATSETWLPLVPTLDALSGNAAALSQRLISDAIDAERPSAAFTKGAIQALTDNAQNGATLVLHRSPYASGSFDPPKPVQSVPAGGAITPVTAIPAESSIQFDGWYDENDALYSSDATLTIPALNDDCTILTAKFTSPPVAITFDLDGKGTFDENNLSSITVLCAALSDFPVVPPFTLYDGYVNLGFTLPDIVPMEDAFYQAHIISSDVRIIRVVPDDENAPLVQNGESWETAYSDLKLAYDDAALYRGEIWMKGGRYLLTSPIILKSNVTIVGGFAGDETSADEADSEANPTVITGDVNDDNYWRPNGNSGAATTHKIWNGLTYMPPNPEGTDSHWSFFVKNSDDTIQAFISGGGVSTNCCFNGLTFTLFGKNVFILSSGVNDGFTIDNCKFLACSTVENTGSYEGPIYLKNTSAEIKNSIFDGCQRAISAAADSAVRITIKDTTFKNGHSSSYGGQVQFYDKAAGTIENCTFFRNYGRSRSYQGGAAMAIKTSGEKNFIRKTKFIENRPWGDCHATIMCYNSNINIDIDGCEFICNSIKDNDYLYEDCNSACIAHQNGGRINVMNTLFEGNSASDKATSKLSMSSVFSQITGSGFSQFVNCTIRNNSVTENSLTTPSGTFHLRLGDNAGFAMINCLVDGSTFSGDGEAWDILNNLSGARAQLGIVNSVILSSPGVEEPIRLYSSLMPTIAGSYISNLSNVTMPALGTEGFVRTHSVAPALMEMTTNEEGIKAVRVKPDVFFGEPVAYSEPNYYLYDKTSEAKPWRRIGMANERKTLAEGEAMGLTLDNLIPDAFGNKPSARRITPGPLNGPNPATFLLLK